MENKYHIELKKGEIACHKQFLLFLQCFPQLYIFSMSKCGIVLSNNQLNHGIEWSVDMQKT